MVARHAMTDPSERKQTMNPQELLAASSRVALAGLVHDIGKFAERAGIDPGAELLESNLHQYARRQEGGGRQWFTHRHAA